MRAASLALAAATCACARSRPAAVVTHPDPTVKIPAIKASVESGDMTAIRQLIEDLESDDPAVRFFAISGLERLTQETFDYQYFVDEEERAPAVEKWKAWLAGWEAAQQQATQP